MIRILNRIACDERGTSLIEMAMLAPFLATLTIGMVDISRGYSEKLFLEQAAQRSVERAMQGMQGDESTEIFEALQAEAAETAGVDPENVTVRYWLECNGVDQNTSPETMAADYDEVCPDGEYYSRHVSVRIEKKFTPLFATKWLGSNTDGTFDVAGEAGMRVQ
jgi:Flp pilus assembly protein TadG